MTLKAIIWDNDGTILGSKDPNDHSNAAKMILPNIPEVMALGQMNIICSGCKTPESELQNFDPAVIIPKFQHLMHELPVQMAVFSPAIGGTECYVIYKLGGDYEIYKAHEDSRYKSLVGHFKKPGTGILQVILDMLGQKFGIKTDLEDILMIGDTWHDQEAAASIGIPFIEAHKVHEAKDFKTFISL